MTTSQAVKNIRAAMIRRGFTFEPGELSVARLRSLVRAYVNRTN